MNYLNLLKLIKKEHTCGGNNIFISYNEIQTYNENIQFAKDLIKKKLKKRRMALSESY